MRPKRALAKVDIVRVADGESARRGDTVAVEEPLEIRLAGKLAGRAFDEPISVTMRTPGEDFELAAGFLVGEGVLREPAEVRAITYCVGARKLEQRYNVVRVRLRDGCAFDLERLRRNVYATSSCGVCGKATLEAVRTLAPAVNLPPGPRVSGRVIRGLPATLRKSQPAFEKTGGLHAAALFDAQGNLQCVCEDVGRHNALDKLVGTEFLAGRLPLHERVLLVSGRASFELLQKAALAGLPVLAAVGAPSSLAVDLARAFGITLLGFVREDRFNVYAGAERVT